MIKLKYSQLNNNALNLALDKLANTSGLSMPVAYRVGKMKKKIWKEIQTGRELFQKMIDTYFIKDDQTGKIQPDPVTGEPLVKPGMQEEFKKHQDEFMNMELEFPFNPIRLDDLEKAKLTPNEILALEPVIADFDAYDNESQDEAESA